MGIENESLPHGGGDELSRLRLLGVRGVLGCVQWSRTTLYQRVREGRFPKPIGLDGRTFWVAGDVEDWLREQIEDARKNPTRAPQIANWGGKRRASKKSTTRPAEQQGAEA